MFSNIHFCGRSDFNELIISKKTKLNEPAGHVQFVVFEKFTSAYYTKLHEKQE